MHQSTTALPAPDSSCACWEEVDRLLRSRTHGDQFFDPLFTPKEAHLLGEGLARFCRHRVCFGPERLKRIEGKLTELDPIGLFAEDELTSFVQDEVRRVSHPLWLAGPLAAFRQYLLSRSSEDEQQAIPWLEAAFIVFMTTS